MDRGRGRDPGLQPERTVMAWQRTIVSLAAANTIGMRLYFPELNSWVIAGVVNSLAALGVLWFLAHRRRQHTMESFPLADLHHRGHMLTNPSRPDGLTLALVALIASGSSAIALVHILIIA
ncbi:DUF202 domain-containing protein [Mycobacterium sp. 21AC1]|uniref:DUF202 domain-containing protein n=1 Tax=[Mycobacterium] appelbergii TaxID=2939269 RepID=UPI0029392B5F|nr:DUF202 domain-containing protein [Mycobacterium sp. 21AC1]MDV3128433.1 DUF202 domain-containing protein [Mycobacterium sp. 21AC1]